MKIPKIFVVLLIAMIFSDEPLFGAAAQPQVIDLWPEGVPGLKPDAGPERVQGTTYSNVNHPRLLVYPPPAGTANGTAVIYCPGGGYVHVAVGGGSIMEWLNPIGVTVFVLIYRSMEYGQPAPQQDVLRAMRLVRSRAAEWGINPNRIGVFGGSAGAHVAASAGVFYDDPMGKTTDEKLDAVSARPDFMILIFPVLTMTDPYAHGQSRANLLGRNPSPELIEKFSLEKHVTRDTPPTFLVHTQADRTVSEQNTIMFYQALVQAGVRTEMHLYTDGPHGSGMEASAGPTAIWPKLAEEWMRWNGFLPPSPTSLLKMQPAAPAPAPATTPAAPKT